jgi:hypothetical protein
MSESRISKSFGTFTQRSGVVISQAFSPSWIRMSPGVRQVPRTCRPPDCATALQKSGSSLPYSSILSTCRSSCRPISWRRMTKSSFSERAAKRRREPVDSWISDGFTSSRSAAEELLNSMKRQTSAHSSRSSAESTHAHKRKRSQQLRRRLSANHADRLADCLLASWFCVSDTRGLLLAAIG